MKQVPGRSHHLPDPTRRHPGFQFCSQYKPEAQHPHPKNVLLSKHRALAPSSLKMVREAGKVQKDVHEHQGWERIPTQTSNRTFSHKQPHAHPPWEITAAPRPGNGIWDEGDTKNREYCFGSVTCIHDLLSRSAQTSPRTSGVWCKQNILRMNTTAQEFFTAGWMRDGARETPIYDNEQCEQEWEGRAAHHIRGPSNGGRQPQNRL